MFELYKVPSLAFGIDSLFSIQNNQHFIQDSLGIAVIYYIIGIQNMILFSKHSYVRWSVR